MVQFDTGQFTKRVREMPSQLFVCRGIGSVYSVTHSWVDISQTLFANSPVFEPICNRCEANTSSCIHLLELHHYRDSNIYHLFIHFICIRGSSYTYIYHNPKWYIYLSDVYVLQCMYILLAGTCIPKILMIHLSPHLKV